MNRKQRRIQAKTGAVPPHAAVPNPQRMFAEALGHHQAGRLAEAERLYRQLLAANPRHSDSLHLLGVLAHQVGRNDVAVEMIRDAIGISGAVAAYHANLGNALMALDCFDDAVAAYRTAIRLKPDLAEAHSNLGNALKRLGQLDEAVAAYRTALHFRGDLAEVHSNLGAALKEQGCLAEAVAACEAAIRLRPDYAEAHSNLGNALEALARFDDAVAAYRAAIRFRPAYAEAHSNLGNALKAQGRLDDAAEAYNTALRFRPDYAAAHYNLANTLTDLGRLDEAVDACAAAIRLQPDFAEAHCTLGVVLKDLGRLDEAVAAFDDALRIRPDLAEAHYNQGNAFKDLSRLEDAAAAYRMAVDCRPDHVDAHRNLGAALKELGRLEEAIDACDTAIRIQPDCAEAHSNLGNALTELGRIDDAVASYRTAIRVRPDLAEVYSNLLLCLHYRPEIGESTILETARDFAKCLEPLPPAPSFANHRDPRRRLRIGYVSGDFRRHPVGYFLVRVLACHDRGAVEVFCYSNGLLADDLTLQLRDAADHWRSLVGLSDPAAADLVAADAIDILIDLSGHTALNRLPMFARRPAPVQVSWLGYFGTTGLAAMDYILADRFVAPEGAAANFTETIWRLPESYLCFSPPDLDCPVCPPPPDDGRPVMFGSFNNNAKTSPPTVALWSRLLHRVPGARLLLKTKALGDAKGRQSLLERFAGHGIAADRLLLEGASPRAELLSSYNRVDVALDPMPYGGGTTTAEALWMGVPVVTLRGGTWVGRVSESILATVGLADLVAATADDYIETAAGLAADKPRLGALRTGLRSQLEASSFCDGTRFTRDLEAAYRGMWQRWCEGTSPRRK